MLQKGSKLYSIVTGSCPRCHSENMYENSNPYNLAKVLKMHEKCSNCDLKYQIEPSFFYGAMYVSYAINVALGVAAFVTSFVIFKASIINAFISIICTLVFLYPVVLRISRNLYINMFVSYDKTLTKKQKTSL